MSKRSKNSKKPGRDEVLSDQKLLERLKALKRFLEDNWGRIGLELARVRQPEDVKTILKSVPNVQWCTPFSDTYPHSAVCLLHDGCIKVEGSEVAQTRDKYKHAAGNESKLFSEYNSVRQKAEEATNALRAAVAKFEAAIGCFPFFLVVTLVANQLEVKRLTNAANELEDSYRLSQKEKQRLQHELSAQESWYARNEIVRFLKSKRFEKTPFNFAKAMAGLPEYGWLHSFRRCSEIQDKSLSESSFNYQLFKIIRQIVRRVKPLKLIRVEELLREALCREDADPLLRSYFSLNWAWIKQAFAECSGKRMTRAHVPFRIMAAFLYHFERSKGIDEIELAKRDQLVCS